MPNYDSAVSWAKEHATKTLLRIDREKEKFNSMDMAQALDDLNKAWDALTDCLVRQKEERDELITKLINELAEAKK